MEACSRSQPFAKGQQTIGKFLEVNGRTFVELVGILAGCGLLIGAFSMTGVVSSLANDLLRLAGSASMQVLDERPERRHHTDGSAHDQQGTELKRVRYDSTGVLLK